MDMGACGAAALVPFIESFVEVIDVWQPEERSPQPDSQRNPVLDAEFPDEWSV